MLADIADEFDCAIDLVSHARKGQPTPGDAERERGASAKKDAGRLMRTVTGMTTAEAQLYHVANKERPALVRVDDAKVNLTPRSDSAMWFKLVAVPLGNATDLYRHGDNVQTVERWYPPDLWATITTAVANQILDRIAEGPGEGRRYSPAPNAKDRAAWRIVQEICPNLTDKQAQTVIDEWIKHNILIIDKEHIDPKDRHKKPGLVVGTRPGDTWEV